jgi:fatty acid synthase subunit alpha
MLVGKYIPNLVAKKFDVSREYAQLIYDQTSSPRLDKVLKKWDQDNWASPEQRQKLAYIILVELLAYQFASPVRWIETQDLLFKDFAFERFNWRLRTFAQDFNPRVEWPRCFLGLPQGLRQGQK